MRLDMFGYVWMRLDRLENECPSGILAVYLRLKSCLKFVHVA